MTALLRAVPDASDLAGDLAYAAGLLTPTALAFLWLWAAWATGGGWG